MYRHPPPRTCSGSKSGYNANLNCVCFNWTWNGWTCLYCEQMIGSATDDLPPGFSTKEEAAAHWYRARFARLSEWRRRVALGLESEEWDVGWEPMPLPKTIRPSAVSAPIPTPPPAPIMMGPPPVPEHRLMNPAIAHAEAMNAMYVNLQMQMQAQYYPQHHVMFQPAPPPMPMPVQDDLSAYLVTPSKVVLEIPPTPPRHSKVSKQEDIEAVEHHPQLSPPTVEGPASHSNSDEVQSPRMDSPMEVEQAVLEQALQAASDAMDIESSSQPSAAATPIPGSRPSSPVASPLSDAPESPGIVISNLLPREKSDYPTPAPQSPTSYAISALLASPNAELDRKSVAKVTKKKPSVARKKSSSNTSTPTEAKARRAPKAARAVGPDSGAKKGGKKETKSVVLKIPATAVGTKTSASPAATKAAKAKTLVSPSNPASSKATPPSSSVPLPETATSSPAAPAPKLWQSIKIPKKSSSFQAPAPIDTTPRELSATLPCPLGTDARGSKVRPALLPSSRA